MSQKGFSQTIIIFAVVGLIIIGAVGYFVFNARTSVVNPTPITNPTLTPTPQTPPPSGQTNPPSNNTGGGTVGILSGVTDCMIPEGCGPKYTLWDSELKSSIPLLGNIKDKDSGLIIRVIGNKTALPPSEYGDMNYRGTTEAIKVSSYSVLSKISYHDFLVDKAGEYTLQKYPCLASKEYGSIFTKYNKTFLWELMDSTPVIKVRMTDTLSGVKPEAFYELWYNANSGNFIKEVDEPKDKVFCQ